MPLVQVDPAAMLNLFEYAKKSMVRISEVVGGREKRAGNGFVVHCSNNFTVVGVHPSYKFRCLRNGKVFHHTSPIVEFWDGTKATQTIFIKLDRYINLIVAITPLGYWEEPLWGKLNEFSRDKLLSVTSLLDKIVPIVGQIISQRAVAVDRQGNEIASSTNTFTFSLPVGGRVTKEEDERPNFDKRLEILKNQVIGSPLYNLRGKLVGFVERCGTSFDFKYGRRSEELKSVIDEWLAGRDWEEAIEAHNNRDQRAGGSKRAKPN